MSPKHVLDGFGFHHKVYYLCSCETVVSETAVSQLTFYLNKAKFLRFFDRTKEIQLLKDIEEVSHGNAQFTVLTGRRRIGKTSLVLKAYEDMKILYFFVSRKAEKDLCQGFITEMETKLGVPMLGVPNSFAEVFEYIMKLSQSTVFHWRICKRRHPAAKAAGWRLFYLWILKLS